MRIDINLASQPYEDSRQLWLRWGSLLAVLGLLTLALLYSTVSGWLAANQDRKLMQQQEREIRGRDAAKARAEATLNLPENRTMRDRSQFLNDLFQRKAFSWTKVFEDLERVMPPRLHVVSIQPEMAGSNQLMLKLRVGGESRERAQELVRKMESSQRFQQTHIREELSAQSSQAQGDNVEFNISATYIPESESRARRNRP
jgi:type IV pilus assembly protein PilN